MAESLIAATLGAQLIETFDNPDYRPPPLPGVALELLSLSNRDDADDRSRRASARAGRNARWRSDAA